MPRVRLLRSVGAAVLFLSSAAGAAMPCPHPYFPIEEGLKLTYRAGKSEVVISFSGVEKSETGVSGNLELAFKDRRGSTITTCGADGVQTGVGGLEGAALKTAGLDVKITRAEGVTLPPIEQMTAGHSWKNRVDLQMRPPSSLKLPIGITPVINTRFEKESTVLGMEKVEVTGGTFEALKVKNRTTASAGIVGMERTVESILWFAPTVGIIKVQTGSSVDFELLKIERAMPVKPATAEVPRTKKNG
jgi:hypothetical protein